MQVKDIMSKDVVSVSKNASVKEAAEKMRDSNVGTIAVIDGDRLVGLINDRQITVSIVANGKNPRKVQVGDVMTKRLVTGSPNMDIIAAARIMGKLHFRRLPVVDRQNHIEGIVSVADLSRPLKEYTDSILDELCKREPRSPSSFDVPSTLPSWLFT